jgi:hypothetical protein
MKRLFHPEKLLLLCFLGSLVSVPLVQVALEARRGEWPQALAVFAHLPDTTRLRAFERDLEEASWTAQQGRPWVQCALFTWLGEAGDKALVGREGWLFYRPGFDYLVAKPEAAGARQANDDPLPAMIAFRDDLAARGIRLMVVPAPNKESVYPDRVCRRATHLTGVLAPQTHDLFVRLRAAQIEVVDLFGAFATGRQRPTAGATAPLYLSQDTHWSPAGVDLAARTVAHRLLELGWIEPGAMDYATTPAPVQRLGDLIHMMQAPPLEQRVQLEAVPALQVTRRDNGRPYTNSPDSEVLVLGDSFLRIYEQDEPGAAGFIAHLACELKQPLSALVSEGGASTLVRQELSRRPGLLKGKKLVIWEFVERDLRFGAEGWQNVPLPPPETRF